MKVIKHSRFSLFFLVLLLFSLLSACSEQSSTENYTPDFTSQSQKRSEKTYIFSIHPLHNPARLHDVFDPLMEYLSKNIDNASFKLEASRNYAAYDKKLFSGEPDFSLPNPYQTVKSLENGYRVFGKMGDDHNFRGIILVRKDSGIEKVEDLKNKAVSYPAPTALAATMMPQYYLNTHGLDVLKDVDNRYVGSQESSIMNVFLGDTAAGATWPPPWLALSKERPELKEQLQIKWETDPLPNNGLVARKDIPEKLVKKVATLLFTLHTHDEGRKILAPMELSSFEAATNETYIPVISFLETFTREVREPQKER